MSTNMADDLDAGGLPISTNMLDFLISADNMTPNLTLTSDV